MFVWKYKMRLKRYIIFKMELTLMMPSVINGMDAAVSSDSMKMVLNLTILHWPIYFGLPIFNMFHSPWTSCNPWRTENKVRSLSWPGIGGRITSSFRHSLFANFYWKNTNGFQRRHKFRNGSSHSHNRWKEVSKWISQDLD